MLHYTILYYTILYFFTMLYYLVTLGAAVDNLSCRATAVLARGVHVRPLHVHVVKGSILPSCAPIYFCIKWDADL